MKAFQTYGLLSVLISLILIPTGACQQKKVLADDIISKIKKETGLEWGPETVDTYKSGHGKMEVTGIATTFLATMDVLKKANADGLNLIITHEPTYYNHLDHIAPLEDDPVLREKLEYIESQNLVIWRFHDYWHMMKPDGIYKGIVGQLGWEDYLTEGSDRIFELPETSLEELSKALETTFDTPTIRYVGNPDTRVTKIGLVLGAAGSSPQIQMLQREDVEAIVIGETREWETVEYVRDAISQGKNKALIIIGHANSEEAGMAYCAEWLTTFIDEVPIRFIPAGDPFKEP